MSTDRCWNRCDRCNRFLPYADFENGNAERRRMTIFASTIDEYEQAVRASDDMWTECAGDRRKACDARARRLYLQEVGL